MNVFRKFTQRFRDAFQYVKDFRYAMSLRRIQRENEEHLKEVGVLIAVQAWENEEWKKKMFEKMQLLGEDAQRYFALIPPKRLTSLSQMQAIYAKEQQFMQLQLTAAKCMNEAFEKDQSGDKTMMKKGFNILYQAVILLDQIEDLRETLKKII